MADCYWHIELDKTSSLLFTFSASFGRHMINRLPFGMSCASDASQSMNERHFGDIKDIKYSGNIVSKEGLKPDPEKVKAIFEVTQPKNKQDTQRILGMVNYLGQYIPNLSQISYPLRNLLRH